MSTMLLRHYRIRLRCVARDPAALGMLALAGVASLLPTGRIFIRMPDVSAAATAAFVSLDFFFLLVWAALVALPVAGISAGSARSTAGGRVLPALPIGPRSRALAEALVGLTFVVMARTPALLFGRTEMGRLALRGLGFLVASPGWAPFWAALARESVLFALVVLPLLVAWCGTSRLDGAALGTLAVVTMLVSGATLAGLAYRPLLLLAFSIALSALVLALVGVEWHPLRRRVPGPTAPVARLRIPWRPSPGPLGQLRRDQLLGPLCRPGVLIAVGVAAPLTLGFVTATGDLRTGMGASLTVLFLMLAANILFFPLGVRLVPSSGSGAASLFNGHFADAWAALPIRREQVLRAVYAHAWVVALLVWLSLCTTVLSRKPLQPLLFELPALPLTAAFLLCVAAGDRRRGALALGALLIFQFGIPVLNVVAVLLAPSVQFPSGLSFFVPGYVLALVGGLPPLVHLRAPRLPTRAAA